jgi:hypothetical protein
MCHDCGKQIYDDEADEAVGGKHVLVYDEPIAFIVCMPCSESPKYNDMPEEDKSND